MPFTRVGVGSEAGAKGGGQGQGKRAHSPRPNASAKIPRRSPGFAGKANAASVRPARGRNMPAPGRRAGRARRPARRKGRGGGVAREAAEFLGHVRELGLGDVEVRALLAGDSAPARRAVMGPDCSSSDEDEAGGGIRELDYYGFY